MRSLRERQGNQTTSKTEWPAHKDIESTRVTACRFGRTLSHNIKHAIPISSHSDRRYVVTKTKDETADKLIEIINALEKASTYQVQADWGGEFRNKALAAELKQRGITLKEAVPWHSETKFHTRTSQLGNIHHEPDGLPKPLWDKASAWNAYTKNRAPHKSLGGKHPDHGAPAAPKRKRKTVAAWDQVLGSRTSTRDRR